VAKRVFENGASAFEQKRPGNHSAKQERIAHPEKKIQTKDEVLAEPMGGDRKLEEARKQRQIRRQKAARKTKSHVHSRGRNA